MKTKMVKNILLLFILTSVGVFSQTVTNTGGDEKPKFVWIENESAVIYPVPVKVSYSEEYFNLFTEDGEPDAAIVAENNAETKAAAVINNQLSKFDINPLPVINSADNMRQDYKIIIRFQLNKDDLLQYGDQSYKINFETNNRIIVNLSGADERGLIYAGVSLSQLIVSNEEGIQLRKAEVFDYPKFSERIFNTSPEPYHLTEDLDWMLRNKMECITFHNKDYSWIMPDEALKNNLRIYKDWKEKYGGVNAILVVNLYIGEYDIEIANDKHIQQLKEFLKFAYSHGVTRYMINADDSPPFKFGDGYILTSENDKKRFSTMAEAHCWLMNDIYNWADQNNYQLELMYCPGFYTYEEMHYGDMELFKDTPWEDDAFGPLKRDLKIIGEQLNKNIEIMWTGPYVCTRELKDEDIEKWADNLQGRTPYLFDNTLYSQLEFTIRSLFTTYKNDFPKDLSMKTGGNGIFLNGLWVNESYRAEAMTANAYMWEEERYDAEASLIQAMINLYGSSNIDIMFKYRDAELELWKTIKQRELWYEVDNLWKSIRKTRFITEKNPFYYHQNYGRFKALRLQLKNSVPEPENINQFKEKCMQLDAKRRNLLNEIESRSFLRLSAELRKEMVELPSFKNIK